MLHSPIDPRLDEIKDCLYRVVVKALIIRHHRILVVQETEGWWGLPGGGLEHSETVEQALHRELKEEVNLEPSDVEIDLRPLGVNTLGIIHHVPRTHIYYQVVLLHDHVRSHELEHRWVTVEEFNNLELSPAMAGAEAFIASFISKPKKIVRASTK